MISQHVEATSNSEFGSPPSPKSPTHTPRRDSVSSITARQARRASKTFDASRVPARSVTASGDVTSRTVPICDPIRSSSTRLSLQPYENGYHFPPKRPFKESFPLSVKQFLKYTTTPLGFFVVLYGLNVVAWGGMLFLLICNAAPAMCNPTCDDIDSPRRKWIEYTSQIVNALFCVTGFGLAPWRFRDLYFLLKHRVRHSSMHLRKLGAIHRRWFRLPGSDKLPKWLGPESVANNNTTSYLVDAVPYPISSAPDTPRTGVRAAPTVAWKLDFVIWMNCLNTFLQTVLSAFMWGFNRYNRPSWAVGLFVALACTAVGLAGLMMFLEERRIKRIEGVPVTDSDRARLERDRELGILHYNNLGDKKPKTRKFAKS